MCHTEINSRLMFKKIASAKWSELIVVVWNFQNWMWVDCWGPNCVERLVADSQEYEIFHSTEKMGRYELKEWKA